MPDPDVFFFYAFALLTLGGGLLTILQRSAVHSAMWLIVSLLGVAGLYLLQTAEFLFVVQIILYIGGIMVLFLFVIMLVNLDEASKQRQFTKRWWLALLCIAAAAIEFAFFLRRGAGSFGWNAAPQPVPAGNTESIGEVLFREYLVPFEVASLLLLVSVVGSLYMARKKVTGE